MSNELLNDISLQINYKLKKNWLGGFFLLLSLNTKKYAGQKRVNSIFKL